jgi:signal transduction histidine kinase
VRIEVRNQVGMNGREPSAGGHGLIGMRERVDAVHGRLATGPAPGGVFRVSARVPRGTA